MAPGTCGADHFGKHFLANRRNHGSGFPSYRVREQEVREVSSRRSEALIDEIRLNLRCGEEKRNEHTRNSALWGADHLGPFERSFGRDSAAEVTMRAVGNREQALATNCRCRAAPQSLPFRCRKHWSLMVLLM